MNVLFVTATDYPDTDEVAYRLAKGGATEHVTYIRNSDHLTKRLADEVGVEVKVFESQYELGGAAYNEEALNWADFVIVYHDGKSAITKWFVKESGSIQRDERGTRLKEGVTLPRAAKINVTTKVAPKRPKAKNRRAE